MALVHADMWRGLLLFNLGRLCQGRHNSRHNSRLLLGEQSSVALGLVNSEDVLAIVSRLTELALKWPSET